MPDIDLPADGEKPYGTKLRTAINAVNDAVDAATEAIADGSAVTDSAVTALVANPASDTRAELNSSFATAAQGTNADQAIPNTPAGRTALAESTELSTAFAGMRAVRPTGPLLAVIGTSLETLSGASSVYYPHEEASYANLLVWLSDGRLIKHGFFSVPGATTQQIHDLQLPQVLALDPKPNACIVGCGPNEAAAGATSGWQALVQDICNQLRTAGIAPVLKIEPPRGAQGAAASPESIGTDQQNAWKREYAAREGLLVIDAFTPIVHVSGGITSAYSADSNNVHLSPAGNRALADDILTRQKLLDAFPAPRPRIAQSKRDSRDLLAGAGVFSGSSTGWSVAGTSAALSLVAASAGDGVNGSWLRMTRASGSSGDSNLSYAISSIAVRDDHEVALKFRTSGLAASGLKASVMVRMNGYTIIRPLVTNLSMDISLATLRRIFDVPAGTPADQARVTVQLSGTAASDVSVDIACAIVT